MPRQPPVYCLKETQKGMLIIRKETTLQLTKQASKGLYSYYCFLLSHQTITEKPYDTTFSPLTPLVFVF